jgi:hypothetical protein
LNSPASALSVPISVSALWPARTELAEAEAELERLRSSAARERKAKKRAGGTNSLCRRQRQ